jgi:antitoxin VapB
MILCERNVEGRIQAKQHSLHLAQIKLLCEPYLAYAMTHADEVNMAPERRARIFKNGRNQAIRIPRGFELPGEEAIVRKEGERLTIKPTQAKSLMAVLETLTAIDEDFPPIADLL